MLNPFIFSEIEAGKILGQGTFCSVLALEHVYLDHRHNKKAADVHNHKEKAQGRKFISDNIISDGKYRYAMKKIARGTFQKFGPLEFAVAVIDLATEAKLLSVIQHKHIIKMRAFSDVDYCSENFFIILDRLNMTLNEQVRIWKKDMPGGYGANVNNMKKAPQV